VGWSKPSEKTKTKRRYPTITTTLYHTNHHLGLERDHNPTERETPTPQQTSREQTPKHNQQRAKPQKNTKPKKHNTNGEQDDSSSGGEGEDKPNTVAPEADRERARWYGARMPVAPPPPPSTSRRSVWIGWERTVAAARFSDKREGGEKFWWERKLLNCLTFERVFSHIKLITFLNLCEIVIIAYNLEGDFKLTQQIIYWHDIQ
jgi:hypothetical protein